MMTNLHLIAHNLAAILSVIAMLYTIAILLINNPRSTVNITLALTAVAVIVFEVSHIWGVSIADPILSRKILMWNLSVIFICIFNYHCVIAALKKEKEKKHMIIFMYILGIGMTIYFIIFPETFILQSAPKMYFPNYYVPGIFHWAMRVLFQVLIPIEFIVELTKAYRSEKSPVERNRILYFTTGLAMGWGFGILPILPIFNIWTDPMLGVLFPVFFAIPFTYAILQYQLLDIKIIAKKAFIYGIITACVGGLISLLILLDDYIKNALPGYPFWATPLLSGIIAVGIGILAWNKLRESDMLKYEFITTVTHKFRTPLTHIKWAAENIKTSTDRDEIDEQLKYIISADDKLVELTNSLADVSDTENTFIYSVKENDVTAMINEVIENRARDIKKKNISFSQNIAPDLVADCDQSRMKFAIQVLIDNAIDYTPNNGEVTVKASSADGQIEFSVKDTGIGLTKEDAAIVFSNFYRGHNARLVDTEGMGIGLYVSQRIIEKHGGRIWVESEGLNRGSTFHFTIPAK